MILRPPVHTRTDTPFPYPTLFRALDAAEVSLPAMDQSLALHEVARYHYFPGWHQQATFFDLYVNLQVWNGLADRHRAIIELACGDMMRDTIARGEAMQWKAMQEMPARGVQVRRWQPANIAAMETARTELVDEHAATRPQFLQHYAS